MYLSELMLMLADCGKQHFWETTFAITSPHHPDNYEDNLRCIYYVHNPFNGLITITFEAFDIEFRVDCDQDYLSVGIPSRRIFRIFLSVVGIAKCSII